MDEIRSMIDGSAIREIADLRHTIRDKDSLIKMLVVAMIILLVFLFISIFFNFYVSRSHHQDTKKDIQDVSKSCRARCEVRPKAGE